MLRPGIFAAGALALVSGSVALLIANSSKPKLKAGDVAPLFEATDQNGQRIRLDSFRGKSDVVLYFYPKDDTSGCTAQACSLRDGYRAIEQAGAVAIGVSADTAESHDKFARKYTLPFSLLPDPKHVIIRQYGVGLPVIGIAKRVTFLIDTNGIIRHVITDTRTKDHDRQVLAALQTIKAL